MEDPSHCWGLARVYNHLAIEDREHWILSINTFSLMFMVPCDYFVGKPWAWVIKFWSMAEFSNFYTGLSDCHVYQSKLEPPQHHSPTSHTHHTPTSHPHITESTDSMTHQYMSVLTCLNLAISVFSWRIWERGSMPGLFITGELPQHVSLQALLHIHKYVVRQLFVQYLTI